MNIGREQILSRWIQNRVKDKETTNCIFYITTPKLIDSLYKDESIKEVCSLFDKYDIDYMKVDTMPGSFNLNRDWIETSVQNLIECAVEYSGVYPVHWDIEDVVRLEEMERNGNVIIMVVWVTDDGKIIQNH